MGCGASASPRAEEPTPDRKQSDELNDEEQPNIVAEASIISLQKVEEPINSSRCSAVDPSLIPDYWYNKKSSDAGIFDDMFYMNESEHAKFDELFKASYVAKTTQDRPCPKGEHGRIAGGCPCNQPSGDPGLPVAYRAFRAIRVEASAMWNDYSEKKQQMSSNRGGSAGEKFSPNLLTHATTHKYSRIFAGMDDEMNEVYAFHGTFVRSALAIAQTDFKIDLAGNNRGSLFGKGCYCTESITKADEYAKDEPGGYYEGVFAVLVCRICMGKLYNTSDDQNAYEKIRNGEFDSTCGKRLFRELVVYDSRQLYPEYIVLYKRIYKQDVAEYIDKLLRNKFFMEVPLHWRNNANKLQDDFQEQHKCTTACEIFFQFLVDTSIGCDSHQVVAGNRIENASLWSAYVDYKNDFTNKLGGPDGERAVGFSDTGKVEETIKACTKFPCKHFSKGKCKFGDKCHYSHIAGASELSNAARAAGKRFPVDELNGKLNERFLWFAGTKQESVRLTKGMLADDSSEREQMLYESLGDAMKHARSKDGNTYVVLTRAVCGTPGETCTVTDGEQGSAITLQTDSQMYPEYVVQLYSEEDLRAEKSGLGGAAHDTEDDQRVKAAIKIQSAWRGHLARKRVRQLIVEREEEIEARNEE